MAQRKPARSREPSSGKPQEKRGKASRGGARRRARQTGTTPAAARDRVAGEVITPETQPGGAPEADRPQRPSPMDQPREPLEEMEAEFEANREAERHEDRQHGA